MKKRKLHLKYGKMKYSLKSWINKKILYRKGISSSNLIHINWLALWFIVLLMLVYGFCHSTINGQIDDTLGGLINFFYGLFSAWYINLFVFVSVAVAFYKALCKIWKDNIISITRVILLAFAIQLLLVNDNRPFAVTCIGLTYKTVLLIMATMLLLGEVFKVGFFRFDNGESQPMNSKSGFTTDNISSKAEAQSSRSNLAKLTLELSLNTDLSKESFAVGIIGDWGSGKTTFLNSLWSMSQGKGYCIEFKPWNCSSPEQIVQDFFDILRSTLAKYVSTLSDDLFKYAKALRDITSDNIKDNLAKSLVSRLPISERKSKIETEIKKLDKPVIVFIDDLDRLSADEIFEVFRLIRNTASFPNLIYFVAFDKTYTVKMLNESYKDSEKYVEKIFQVEVPLPYAEPSEIERVFIDDVKSMLSKEDINNLGVGSISYNDLGKLAKVLNNFREMRRLARIYVLEIEEYKKQYRGLQEISAIDLLWLTVIMMADYHTYRQLFFNFEYFFTDTDLDASTLLSLRKDNTEEIKPSADVKLKESSKLALSEMFQKRNVHSNSIRYYGNYFNYFYLGLGKGFLSIADFNDILSEEDEIETKIKENYSIKSLDNFYMRFKQYSIKGRTLAESKNYFKAMLVVINEFRPLSFAKLLDEKLDKSSIKGDVKEKLHTYVVGLIEDYIGNIDKDRIFLFYARFLNRCYYFYPSSFIDDGWEYPYLLDYGDIKSLLEKIIKRYLLMHPDTDAYDVLNKGNFFYKIYRECAVEEDIIDSGDNLSYENMCVGVIIDYFSQDGKKSNQLKKAEKAFITDTDDYYEGAERDTEIEKEKTFTSDALYQKYLVNCFIH